LQKRRTRFPLNLYVRNETFLSPASTSALISGDRIHFLRCGEKFPYTYGNCLNASIRTVGNTTMHCMVRQPLLQNVVPKLAKFSYETYLHKKASSVYMLRYFRIHNKFTLNEDNAILHIG
jgi:hypothetical protein